MLLPLFQIIRHFDFIRFINDDTHIDIHYV
jgi:hypothetical protein